MKNLMRLIMLVAVVAIVTACQLGTEPATAVPSIILNTVVSPVTQIPATQQPTQIVIATDNSFEPVVTVSDSCQLQHDDWHHYTVQVADTLGQIATRTNSTVNEIAIVNCLVNANNIEVGQILRVPINPSPSNTPILPIISHVAPDVDACMVVAKGGSALVFRVGVTQSVATLVIGRFVRVADNAYILDTPELGGETWVSRLEAHIQGTACPDEFTQLDCMGVTVQNNDMTVSPSTAINDNCIEVISGNVTVTYTSVPDEFIEATFWVRNEQGNTNVIGVDRTPEDGASVDYFIAPTFDKAVVYVFVIVERGIEINSGELAMYRAN